MNQSNMISEQTFLLKYYQDINHSYLRWKIEKQIKIHLKKHKHLDIHDFTKDWLYLIKTEYYASDTYADETVATIMFLNFESNLDIIDLQQVFEYDPTMRGSYSSTPDKSLALSYILKSVSGFPVKISTNLSTPTIESYTDRLVPNPSGDDVL